MTYKLLSMIFLSLLLSTKTMSHEEGGGETGVAGGGGGSSGGSPCRADLVLSEFSRN